MLFVGKVLLGFSEKEVGHMTFRKWQKLFEHYKEFYNFKMENKLFKLESEEDDSFEWFKD